jgi:hypothetical protein
MAWVVIALILPIAIKKVSIILAKQLKRNMEQTELIYFIPIFRYPQNALKASAHMRIRILG